MESSNSNSKERELQLTQRLAKQRHSNCMTWFEQLETHLHDLYLLNSPYAVDAFKPAFRSFFGEEHQTFKLKMFHNLDQLRLQLERENLHGVNAKTCLQALRTQFKEFLASKGVNATDLLNQGWQQDFEDFTRCEPSAYRRELLENLDTLEAVIHRVVNTYGVLRMKENEVNALKENGSQLHDEILHEHQIKSSVKMQSQDIQINPVQAMDDSLIISKSSLIEPENNNAFSKSEIETQMQRKEEKVDMCEVVDAGLVVTESSGTKPDKQDTSSSSGNYFTQAVDADIRPINDEEPFAEVQLTALHNILANEQQHTEQSEPNYDTHLLETIDSNTTPTSTNMCHRGGEIDQDALLNAELLKTKDMAKTTLICDLKNQIKSVKEASNEAKVKNDIDVIETINIELEHSVAKLLAANEQLHKEKEHLKQTYKELYDTIKKTRVQNKDNSDSLISQINQKSVENADLKAQIQEKVFANAALKNELRKLKGNIVDSKFAKASILGKPPLQPSRNHLVVRQPNAFTSERPRMSRPRFASQVDEKNDLSKTVTPHYLPKVRESAAAKPHQVNAPNYSRNSHKESYGSNDMVHAYFLEDARKMTQDKTRIPNHRDMASTRAHCTPNACTPKPRNIYRSSPVSKCSGGMSNGEPLVDHSRNSSFFLDSKQFVCSICHKYIFNTNHDDCIIKILNKVNSCAKVQSLKIRNNNPVEPKNHTHKPGRQIGIGQRFSLNKSSAVHEKPHTPRSCLRWKPTGRIFKTVSLRWIPTGKMFTDSTTKVDSEPPNGSNDDITNPYECNQTLYFSAGTSNSSAGLVLHLDDIATPSRVTSGVSMPVSTQGQAGSDPEKVHEALSGPDLEPMQEDQTGSNSGKLHVSLAGPNPEHMDDEFLATAYPKVHENLKLITDERVIEENPESHSGSMSSMKNLDDTYNFGDQFLYDKPTEDDQEKSKVIEESDSTIPDPSHQTVTSTPPVIAPFTDVSSTKPSSLVTPPPINTEATTITTSLPEITPFIALQLRVARLEQEMSEVKKTDHSADVLASIKSQVPTVVDKYLGTKLDDALLKILERHTADLIEKYSALPGPESIKNQESEKSPKEIIRIKREQGEEKQDSTYSIRSTDKVALEEFDLKSALFKHMNKNKTANRNPANYHLYHALMEALIADEDAMDKEVAVKVKDHKRKHDSDDEEDDDDDEGPSAGSNQGRSAKRRRPESAASGSAQPPSKDDHQSSKKPRESDASASKQHPALTSTGWQITDTRDDVVNSLMHMLPNNIQITDTNSFIVSKKRSSDSSKKLKGIQTLTPAEQEAADIMKALKESKKMSKRQPGTGGSNEGTGNILGVPDESTVISRASSEGTGSKPGVPDEEKLIL
ncbi:hypothetical protein Tco_0795231 [Tanacetum coccineum]